MKMFRMVGEDQCMGGPVNLGGPLGVGWLCAFLLGPQRSAHSLGTVVQVLAMFTWPLTSALSLLPLRAPSPPPTGVSGGVCPRPRLTPLPGKMVPAYLVGFSAGVQVEMSVSLSFIWWVTLYISAGPPEVPLVQHLLSPGGLGAPKNMGQRFLCSLASHTPAL